LCGASAVWTFAHSFVPLSFFVLLLYHTLGDLSIGFYKIIVKNPIIPTIAQIAELIVKIHARTLKKYSHTFNRISINISFDLSF
jgi:hypothetical protein